MTMKSKFNRINLQDEYPKLYIDNNYSYIFYIESSQDVWIAVQNSTIRKVNALDRGQVTQVFGTISLEFK